VRRNEGRTQNSNITGKKLQSSFLLITVATQRYIVTLHWPNPVRFCCLCRQKNMQIFLFIFFLSSFAFADTKVILPKLSLVTLSESFPVTIQVSSEKNPASFLLSHVEGPKLENLTMVDSKISTVLELKSGKPILVYRLEWRFQAETLGLSSLTLPTLTFQDEKGNKTEKKFSEVLKVEVVRWHRKYRALLGLGLGAVIGVACAIVVRRKRKIARKKQEILEQALAFKQLKISKEHEAREKTKELSVFIISGEYGTFCHRLADVFSEYFKSCYGLRESSGDGGELRTRFLKYFDPAFHGRLNQWLDLLEQVQFGAVRPLSGDLDRLPQLMLELIAIHREHGKKK
jgi:hypothetical protein